MTEGQRRDDSPGTTAGGWSFTGPSATLPVRPWQPSSTLRPDDETPTASRGLQLGDQHPGGQGQKASRVEPAPAVTSRRAVEDSVPQPTELGAEELLDWGAPAAQPVTAENSAFATEQWRAPELPSAPEGRSPTPIANRTLGVWLAAMLGLVILGVMTAVFSAVEEAEVPAEVVAVEPEDQEPVDDPEVQRFTLDGVGTFTVPPAWSVSSESSDRVGLLWDQDATSSVLLAVEPATGGTLAESCKGRLESVTGDEIKPVARVPKLLDSLTVGYAATGGQGIQLWCSERPDALLVVEGTGDNGSLPVVTATMREIAASLG